MTGNKVRKPDTTDMFLLLAAGVADGTRGVQSVLESEGHSQLAVYATGEPQKVDLPTPNPNDVNLFKAIGVIFLGHRKRLCT